MRDASKGDIGQVLCGRRTCQGACVCVEYQCAGVV